jgi:hypothetical protein
MDRVGCEAKPARGWLETDVITENAGLEAASRDIAGFVGSLIISTIRPSTLLVVRTPPSAESMSEGSVVMNVFNDSCPGNMLDNLLTNIFTGFIPRVRIRVTIKDVKSDMRPSRPCRDLNPEVKEEEPEGGLVDQEEDGACALGLGAGIFLSLLRAYMDLPQVGTKLQGHLSLFSIRERGGGGPLIW